MRALVQENRPLGLRSLATAQRLRDKTVAAAIREADSAAAIRALLTSG